MRFFTPQRSFWTFLQKLDKEKKRLMIECGSGFGDLVIEAHQFRLPMIGIEPFFPGYEHRQDEWVTSGAIGKIIEMPAEESNFILRGDPIILTCRPCHDGFPARVNELRSASSRMFYIGLAKNIEQDLHDVRAKLLLEDCGNEGENLWEVFQ